MAKSQKELNHDLKNLQGAAKTIHLDVVDGKFAHNKTFQFPFRLSKKFNYNAHLMVKNPEKWVDKYGSKVELIIFQPEVLTKKKVSLLIKKIKNKKKKVGLALSPQTKVKDVQDFLKDINYILILTVHPGFYGSKFLPENLKKITQVKKINHKIKIIVDGGMNPKTIVKAAKAGADYFVSGSYTTKADDPQKSIKELKKKVI